MAALKRKAELLKQIMGNLELGNGYVQSKRRGRLQIARFSSAAESLQHDGLMHIMHCFLWIVCNRNLVGIFQHPLSELPECAVTQK